MKSRSFVPIVAIVVLVLANAFEEVQLVSNFGRRFGRSLMKKHPLRKTFEPQEASPLVHDEDEVGDPRRFNEYQKVSMKERVSKHYMEG